MAKNFVERYEDASKIVAKFLREEDFNSDENLDLALRTIIHATRMVQMEVRVLKLAAPHTTHTSPQDVEVEPDSVCTPHGYGHGV